MKKRCRKGGREAGREEGREEGIKSPGKEEGGVSEKNRRVRSLEKKKGSRREWWSRGGITGTQGERTGGGKKG